MLLQFFTPIFAVAFAVMSVATIYSDSWGKAKHETKPVTLFIGLDACDQDDLACVLGNEYYLRGSK